MAKFMKISEARKKKAAWLFSHMIPYGSVSLMSGDGGVNKSFLLAFTAARVTRGESMPFSPVPEKAGGVMILNSEDPDDEIEARFLAAGGNIERLFIVEKGTTTLPGDIQSLREFVRANDIRLIIVDPLESFVEGSIMSRTAVRRVLDPLNRLAEELDIAIVVVRHLTKSTSAKPQYRGVGSGALTGAVRSEVLVAPSPTNPDHRVIVQMKSNLGPLSKSIEFRLKPSGETATIDWLGQCEITAEDALNTPNRRERDALNEAKELLVSVLWDQPVLAREVRQIAQDAFVLSATLRRAKVDLKVISQRIGFGRGSTILWVLPDRDDPSVASYVDDIIDDLSTELFHGNDSSSQKRLPYHEKGDEDSQQPSDDDQPEQPV